MSNLCPKEFGNRSNSIVRLTGFPNRAHLDALNLEFAHTIVEPSTAT